MTEKVITEIPTAHIAFLLVNGFAFLLLTPLHVILAPWMNPFTQTNPTEALSNIALLFIIAAASGAPGILLKGALVGENGLNARLRYKKYKKNKDNREKEKNTENSNSRLLETVKESIWINEKKAIDLGLKFLAIKYAIVTGTIIGSQLAFGANLIFVIFTIKKIQLGASLWLLIIPVIVGLIAWLYYKKYFKHSYEKSIEVIHLGYLEHLESQTASIKGKKEHADK